jgi:hypothetical protein
MLPSKTPRRLWLHLACLAAMLVLAAPAVASRQPSLDQTGVLDSFASATTGSQAAYLSQSQAWNNVDATGAPKPQNGFFDFLTDWLDWFNDKKDEVTGDKYSDAGIPHDPFFSSQYGMNVQQLNSMSVDDFSRVLRYAGPWVRFNMSTAEVSENNWFRLDPGLSKLRAAADSTGIQPHLVVNLSGYSSGGDEPLSSGLSWDDKASRYSDLAYRLTNRVRSQGFGDAVFEAWNEPDNTSPSIGIGPGAGSADFTNGLTKLCNAFSTGVHRGGGTTAFSPFMTLNDSKIDSVRTVWNNVQGGFDYFSAHMYDDDAGHTKYWAAQTHAFTGDKPVIITEHGYNSSPQDVDKYRRQAWALYQGFGSSNLQGVMGYVYASDDSHWAIGANDDFFWKVTHASKP